MVTTPPLPAAMATYLVLEDRVLAEEEVLEERARGGGGGRHGDAHADAEERGDVEADGMWRHHEAYIEAQRSREGCVFVWWSGKMLESFSPKGYLSCVLHVRAF